MDPLELEFTVACDDTRAFQLSASTAPTPSRSR
jgi:hypothetical protein